MSTECKQHTADRHILTNIYMRQDEKRVFEWLQVRARA